MIKKYILMSITVFIAFFVSPVYAEEIESVTGVSEEKNVLIPNVALTVERIENKGDKKRVQIKLIKTQDNTPLTLNDLKEAHTKKIHVMIIDAGLDDYSHVHPQATGKPGLYEFDWQPKKMAHYRLWADLMPLHTNEQEYVVNELTVPNNNTKASINKKTIFQNTVSGLTFTLSFDTPALQVGKAAMGNIRIVDSKGAPVKNLEPLMGAFAHIVGFEEDFKTIVHVHPMGAEPKKSTDRGGPEFQFHIEPEKAGFMRLFAQVRVNGKEIFVPFGITINPA